MNKKIYSLTDSNGFCFGYIYSIKADDIDAAIKKQCEDLAGKKVLYIANNGCNYEVAFEDYAVYVTLTEKATA